MLGKLTMLGMTPLGWLNGKTSAQTYFCKICNVFPNLRGGGHIDFVADSVGIGICVGTGISFGVGMTLSSLHNILWTSGWILIKFPCINHWDITQNWLDFGDIDLIFKVTAIEKLKIHGWRTSVFSENMVATVLQLLSESHF